MHIGILVIHGIGNTEKGYSEWFCKKVQSRLKRHLKGGEHRVVWQEIVWGRELAYREKKLWYYMKEAHETNGPPIRLRLKFLRRFLIHYVSDAFAYNRPATKSGDGTKSCECTCNCGSVDQEKSTYEIIHKTVSGNIERLNEKLGKENEKAPIIVIAHSLGAYIMSNYIWDRQKESKPPPHRYPIPNLLSMITVGCNIPLFSFSFPKQAKPIRLPGEGITDCRLKAKALWLNILNNHDVLGWPLKPLYEQSHCVLNEEQRNTVGRIRDCKINIGDIWTSWNPFSHIDYLKSRRLTKKVAKHLKEILDCNDAPSRCCSRRSASG